MNCFSLIIYRLARQTIGSIEISGGGGVVEGDTKEPGYITAPISPSIKSKGTKLRQSDNNYYKYV